jgi:hypothetical protein
MDITVVTLESVTVFWEDLGLPEARKQTSAMKDVLAKWWDDEVEAWLVENAKHPVNPHEAGVWFFDSNDAIMFKLVFAGTGPNL